MPTGWPTTRRFESIGHEPFTPSSPSTLSYSFYSTVTYLASSLSPKLSLPYSALVPVSSVPCYLSRPLVLVLSLSFLLLVLVLPLALVLPFTFYPSPLSLDPSCFPFYSRFLALFPGPAALAISPPSLCYLSPLLVSRLLPCAPITSVLL